MPGALLHVGASVLCAHGGTAVPSAPNLRVLVNGQPTVTTAAPYVIAGCPFISSGAPLPCATGHWVRGSIRVLSNGQPLVLMESEATCVPNGTPLLPVAAQTRVIGS